MKEPTYFNMQESTSLIAGNIIKASSELLKNGKGDYYRNQEQMARAIELRKFLSSKKEIAAADDVRLFRIKEDILQYMSRGVPKRAYGRFWCTWSKFDRGKR